MNIDIMGVMEMTWTESERAVVDKHDYVVLYNVGMEHIHGVGFIIEKKSEKYLNGLYGDVEKAI